MVKTLARACRVNGIFYNTGRSFHQKTVKYFEEATFLLFEDVSHSHLDVWQLERRAHFGRRQCAFPL